MGQLPLPPETTHVLRSCNDASHEEGRLQVPRVAMRHMECVEVTLPCVEVTLFMEPHGSCP